jgi:prepilin-type N-terminal cleavage/methylation domain-containing protein
MRSGPDLSIRERGITLVEVLVALVVLSVGILAVGGLFPAGARNQLSDRMLTNANYYAQQQVESLSAADWSGTDLAPGRHPSTGSVALGGNGRWQRWYEVSSMAAPLDNLKKVTVTVSWNFMGSRQVTATTYLRR